jgi:hypothetical protein
MPIFVSDRDGGCQTLPKKGRSELEQKLPGSTMKPCLTDLVARCSFRRSRHYTKKGNDPPHECISAESGEESSPNESPAAANRVRSETSHQRPRSFAGIIVAQRWAATVAFLFFVVDRFE